MFYRSGFFRFPKSIAVCAAVALGMTGALSVRDAAAAPVFPVSYDMLNGNGTNTSGIANFWDRDYTGTGSVAPFTAPHTTDGEALTGGLGDLTDGVIATADWISVETVAGDGPYVGWLDIDPVITFHFGSSVSIDTVTLYLADSPISFVEPPKTVNIEGTDFTIVNPVDDVPFSVSFSGLGFTGTELTLELRQTSSWIFMSEVTFDGQGGGTVTPLPTPGPLLLLGGAILGLGVARRRTSGRR
tara:strand:+ start:1735 stop:2463 length:729 start_codon:yes stop_codon:yes gene_type:complete